MDRGPFHHQQQPRYGPQGPAGKPQGPGTGNLLSAGFMGGNPYAVNGQQQYVAGPMQAAGQYRTPAAATGKPFPAGQQAAAERLPAVGGKRRFAEETLTSAQLQQQQRQQRHGPVPPPRPPPGSPPFAPPRAATQPAIVVSYQQEQYRNQQDGHQDQGQKPSGRSSDPYLSYYGSRAFTQNNAAAAAAAPSIVAPPPAPPRAAAPEPRIDRQQQRPSARSAPTGGSANGSVAAPKAGAVSGSARAANGRQQQQQPQAGGEDFYEASARQLEELGGRASSHGNVYTRLTQNIVQLVKQVDPDSEALRHRRRVLQAVSDSVRHAFPEYPHARVQPFGSFVSGLGTAESDMDLVITGIQEPPSDTGFYAQYQRPQVARVLDRATSALYRSPELRGQIRRHLLIRSARIPIAKFTLQSGLVIDLSVAGESGPQAAAYLARQAASWPALRPLALTIKAYLKAQQVNDVSQGGLSSYGVTYMVLAHLMEERKAGADTEDLGYMLHRFFQRFGASYDQCTFCVAVGLGGVVTRWHALNSGAEYFKNDDRLATVDPLTGRDCTEGCYESGRAMDALQGAERYLNSAVNKYKEHSLVQLRKVDILEGLVLSVSFEDDDEDEGYQHEGLGFNRPRKRR